MTFRFVAGIIVGAVAMWAWSNREALGWAVDHRNQLDAASRLKGDVSDLLGGLSL